MKNWLKISIIVCLVVLSIVLWVVNGFNSFLTTIIAGLIVGLISSFSITYLFELEKKKSRDNIRSLVIENFVYSCADYIQSLELWYKEYSGKEVTILDDAKILLDLLEHLRDEHKEINSSEIDKKYSMLKNDYVYSISPVYYAYRQLDNQQLLLNDVLNLTEYKFFHNVIRGDIFDECLNTKKKDRFGDNVKGYYIFHQLRICLNCVIDASKIFPEIKEKYLQINSVKNN